MQINISVNDWERRLQLFLILVGFGAIFVSITADLIGVGGQPGIGPNQVSVLLSGLASLITGFVLISSIRQRPIAEWLLVGIGILATAFAADLLIINGLPDFGAKQMVMVFVISGLLLAKVQPVLSVGRPSARDWFKVITREKIAIGKFLAVFVQLGFLAFLIHQFKLENQALYSYILPITFYGFLIHHLLPKNYRIPFFLLLSLVTIIGILGVINAVWLIGIGLGLIGIAHLPLSFRLRVGMLLVTGAGLAALRVEWLQSALPGAIWPILGSMFMFRLIVYMHDLRRQKEPVNLFQTLAYFFLLPNVVFPLFPIVDYSTFRRTYYQEKDPYQIYQSGLVWIFWGAIHLILYRFVNYYLVISPEDVINVGDLVRYIVSNFLLILRVSGQFHLAVGILHMFGFNLPRTMRDYLLASSFTDFWRRANVYWKDFMLKIFYYPVYFQLRRFGATLSLVLATVLVFVCTWALHLYQWFWLRGSILFSLPDISFWLLFGIVVLINVLYETKHGSKQHVGKKPPNFREITSQSLKTMGTFAIAAILFSLWFSTSLPEWISLWSVNTETLLSAASLAPFLLLIGGIFFGTLLKNILGEGDLGWFQTKANFFNSVLAHSGLILLVLLIGLPGVNKYLGQRTQSVIADLKVARLSDRDSRLLVRGYYENLIGINIFNSELWEIYTKKPSDWPLIQDTELARFTKDFYILEMVPSKSILYHGERFSTNRWGMRDKDYEQIAPPDTYRAVLLGPSFIMGSGVADDEVFEWLLEERLNREKTGEKYARYEILNFGIAGYSALQELAIFENKALSFKPDAVFYVAHQLEEDITVRNLASRYLAGVDIPYEYLEEIKRRSGIEEGMTQVEAEQRLKPFGPEIVSWTYRRMVEVSMEKGVTPIWIILQTLETQFSEPEVSKLIQLAEEANFIVLNLSDIYEDQEVDKLIVAEWDKHPNAQGHKLIAERLYEALRQEEILK